MTVKRQGIVDRKALYIPDTGKWEWKKLSAAEVDKRLAAARDSLDKLNGWASELAQARLRQRDEVWNALRSDARLTEYVRGKDKGWRVAGQTALEEMGRELGEIEKLITQCEDAISTIMERGRLEGLISA